MKSGAANHTEEMSSEKYKRQIIEQEYDKISAQLEGLMKKYSFVGELEEKYARLL